MGIFPWLKTHLGIEWLLKLGKSGYEVAEARSKNITAASEARQAVRREDLDDAELKMFLFDEDVKKDLGHSYRIVDPNIYVERLKLAPDLVQTIWMRRGDPFALGPAETPARWKSRWS